MTDIMAIDIETGNYSWEIGGWQNTHMFEPTVVATWDGNEAHIFSKEDLEVEGATVHSLHPRDLGEHLQKHVEKGGQIVGHNIVGFDLPVLRDALDCFYAGELIRNSEHTLDTSHLLRSSLGYHLTLNDVCRHTLEMTKSMDSSEAPEAWREGRFNEVAEYCLKDAKLSYDLWKYGKENGLVKARCVETGIITDYEVAW